MMKGLVTAEGFEPSTPRAEIWYSIQLNYAAYCFANLNNIVTNLPISEPTFFLELIIHFCFKI